MNSFEVKQFEELSLNELYELLKLRIDVFVVEQACAYPELDNQDQQAWHVMRNVGGELIGYARILFEKGGLHIGRIVVSPTHRNQGLGREILNYCLAYCEREHANEAVHLSAQAQLEEYYKSFGFKTVSEPYDWDGIIHVDMIK